VVAPPTRHKGRGASSSAAGEIGRWIPVNSTVATTSRVTVPISTQATQATSIPIPSINQIQFIPVSLPLVPVSSISATSFSLPLHNVFGSISNDEFTVLMPVLEDVSLVAHDDVQSVEVGMSHQKPREELENPTVNIVTSSLLDSVEHNHGNPRELE